LLSSTIGDELVIHTGGRSRSFGVSTKDRGAILTGGACREGVLVFKSYGKVCDQYVLP